MIKITRFSSALAMVAIASLTVLAGCDEKPAADASGSPTAASPAADASVGPPAPPPAAAEGAAPVPFKGTGKVVSDPAGFKYEDMTVGTGPKPKDGQYVQVQYVGTGENGSIFDSSYKHGTPFEFQLGAGNVIKGWDLGVAGMTVGSRRKIILPGNLAYGETPPPGAPFKANETLTFDIELLGATDKPTQ